MKLTKINSRISVLALVLFFGCADLSVDNMNNPETQRALSNAGDLVNLLEGQFQVWYMNSVYAEPYMFLNVSADATTMSWGNFGAQDAGKEPRVAFDNAPNYSYSGVGEYLFEEMYNVNSSATDVLTAVESGVDFGSDKARVEALGKFLQGLSMMHVALVYDQGFIVDENTPDEELLNLEFKPYTEVAAHAYEKLQEVIAISNSNSFTLGESVFRTTSPLSSADFARLAHSYSARLLANMPRNASQNSQVDWSAVMNHAQNGIDFDFGFVGNGSSSFSAGWLSYGWYYSTNPGWARADMYVVNMMDDSYPAHNPDGQDFPPADPNSVKDQRLVTDFQHLASNVFSPDRGLYYFSSFRHSRYDAYRTSPAWSSWFPEFYQTENDLYLAEAMTHLGQYGPAADIINSGTRVTRGGMAAVGANQAEIMEAIHHERMVELHNTALGLEYFQMRKHDLLQTGTALQLPVPGKVLELMGHQRPFYSFGGVSNADGVGTSNGGWR